MKKLLYMKLCKKGWYILLVIKCGKEHVRIENDESMEILRGLDLFETIKKYNRSKAAALKVEIKEKLDLFKDNIGHFFLYQSFGNNTIEYTASILEKLISFLNKHSDEKIIVYEEYENGLIGLCR